MIDNAFLTIDRVSKSYPQHQSEVLVLQDISVSILPGQVVAFVGASGCGKSTLLRVIAGLVSPTTGAVQIDGRSPVAYQQSGQTGFVFQNSTLFPWWTLLQNVLLPTKIKSELSIADQNSRAASLLQMLGLSGFENAYPRQLSGGMLQRAAIARALMLQPQLLLLDEPFSALDELTREALWVDFNQIWRKQNLTVLLVTHSITEAVFFADQVVVLSPRPGKIQMCLEISLPAERQISMIDSPEFVGHCQRIREQIRLC
jgi:NitT/TauT family transport system ATP-binding protein